MQKSRVRFQIGKPVYARRGLSSGERAGSTGGTTWPTGNALRCTVGQDVGCPIGCGAGAAGGAVSSGIAVAGARSDGPPTPRPSASITPAGAAGLTA